MHLAHQRLMGGSSRLANTGPSRELSLSAPEERRSLPAFIVGRLIALLCRKLEKVQCSSDSGV
jgi:hypothetical protein